MVGPAEKQPLQAEIKRLSLVIEEIINALRAQRSILRQRGMSLPPGTLNGLKEVQDNLDILADQLISDSVELEQLRALAKTSSLVTSSLDINQVLNEVIDSVISLTGAQRGYIMLRDSQTGEMEFRIARNMDRETIAEGSFVVSRTIVSDVAQTGTPVLTTNALDDEKYGGMESVMIHGLRSILCVPLIVKGNITGVVYVDNTIKDGLFDERQKDLLYGFANQAAIAIENARLFERVQRALAEVTEMKELMDNVFASIASGVIATDIAQIVTTYNIAAERILSTPHDSVLGSPLEYTLSTIYDYVQTSLDAVFRQSLQEIIEIEPELPGRGKTNLNLKLTPLKNQQQTEGVTIVVDDLTEIKRRDATLNVVRRYLPPVMVDNIQSLDGLGLGGERRTITVMFVEVRPFHTFPAHLNPQELMELLNLYLTLGADTIHKHTGLIDKFMGNEIMGLFNTQLNPSDDHAWGAIQAALKIAEDYMAMLIQAGEKPIPYYRVGIHTGVATLGNVGSHTRREFTAIGDTVNLTKRLQDNASAGQIIISDATFQHCRDQLTAPANGISVFEQGSVQVRGRSQAVQIYEIQRE